MALYLRLSKEYVKKKNDYLNAIVVTIVFAIMAMMLNGYLETDFMMLRVGAGNPLQFIIEQYGYIYYVGLQGAIMTAVYYIFLKLF